MGDTWQMGTTSIREDQLIASGLRFVQRRHASANVDARKDPKNNPTVRVYQHLEDELTRAEAGNEGVLALTTTREGALNLHNYFDVAGKKANAETAVKVAGATAKHCIVIHGESTFLSGERRYLDYDQECFTRANVAYSRATNLTILACPLNTQGMPGALQVLAALLHGVQTIYTYDGNEPMIRGSLDLTPIQVEQATAAFQQALLPHALWDGPLPVCPAEHHEGKARRLRLVLATLSHLTKAEQSSLQDGPHLPGGAAAHELVFGYALDACQRRNGKSQMDNSRDAGGSCATVMVLAKGAASDALSATSQHPTLLSIERQKEVFHAAAFPWFCSAAGTCSPHPANILWPHMFELGRPSVAGPVFAGVFRPQTGAHKNHFFRSLEGAKSLENL